MGLACEAFAPPSLFPFFFGLKDTTVARSARNHTSVAVGDANATIRAAHALKLRLKGQNYTEIGEALGISRSTAHKYVTRLLDRTVSLSAEHYRTLNTMRLEALLAAVWEDATNPRNPNYLWAMDRSKALIEALNKLHGLDVAAAKETPNLPMVIVEAYPEGVLEAV